MIYILCENTVDNICSGIDAFYAKFPESTRVRLSNNVLKESLDAYKQPPLLASRWLFLCSEFLVKKNVRPLCKLALDNVVIINTISLQRGNEIKELFREYDVTVKIINNTVIKPEKVIAYIRQNGQCSEEVAKYVYKRYNGYMPAIARATQTLSLIPGTTKVDVRRYTERGINYTLADLASFLLGEQRKHMSSKDAIGVVYNFRYAMKYVSKYLQNYINIYLEVFKEMSEANLTIDNVDSFLNTTSNKVIKKLSSKRLSVIAGSFDRISIDKLLYINHYVQKLGNNSFSSYKLITLIKTIALEGERDGKSK